MVGAARDLIKEDSLRLVGGTPPSVRRDIRVDVCSGPASKASWNVSNHFRISSLEPGNASLVVRVWLSVHPSRPTRGVNDDVERSVRVGCDPVLEMSFSQEKMKIKGSRAGYSSPCRAVITRIDIQGEHDSSSSERARNQHRGGKVKSFNFSLVGE